MIKKEEILKLVNKAKDEDWHSERLANAIYDYVQSNYANHIYRTIQNKESLKK